MRSKIIIIGAGENGMIARNILIQCYKEYDFIGFLDDKLSGEGVVGKIIDCNKYIKNCYFFVSVGNNFKRSEIINFIKTQDGKFLNAIHSKAFIEEGVNLGVNIMVGANSYININTSIEDGVFVNNGCIVEHDSQLGFCTHLAPGVIGGGGVQYGNRSFIGLGAVINDHIIIGEDSVVGSGSVVICDVLKNLTVVGVPAKPIIN